LVSKNKTLKTKAAFSLLEVLISVAILSLVAISVYQITSQSVQLADETEEINEFRNSVRVVMKFMSQEIRMAFIPLSEARLYRKKIKPAAEGETPPAQPDFTEQTPFEEDGQALKDIAPEPGTPVSIFSPFRVNQEDPPRESRFYTDRTTQMGSRIPRFQGNKNEFSFITSGFERTSECERTSVFSKIHYKFDSRKRELIRIEDTDVFNTEDVDKSETISEWPVLENLTDFQVAYFDWATEKWESKWDSQELVTLDRYPVIVEIKFSRSLKSKEAEEESGNENVSYDFLYRFPIELSQIVHSLQKEEMAELRNLR
jgi:prepilin-type N-terminal cleavage/methylation domain-containing protein